MIVARGSSAPDLGGKFNDKTAIEADRTGGALRRQRLLRLLALHRPQQVNIYFVRSTDHGVTFSKPGAAHAEHEERPGPRHRGHRQRPRVRDLGSLERRADRRRRGRRRTPSRRTAVQTFSPGETLVTYTTTRPGRRRPDGGRRRRRATTTRRRPRPRRRPARPPATAATSQTRAHRGYTFFRRSTPARSTADQKDAAHEWRVRRLRRSQARHAGRRRARRYGIDRRRATGSQAASTSCGSTARAAQVDLAPKLIDPQARGAPAVLRRRDPRAACSTSLWWDSRNDACYYATRPDRQLRRPHRPSRLWTCTRRAPATAA